MAAVRANTQHLAYISRNTRWLFRKSVWFDVSCLLSSREEPGTGTNTPSARGDDAPAKNTKHGYTELQAELNPADAVTALKHTNWNMVERAKQVVRSGSSSSNSTADNNNNNNHNNNNNTATQCCPIAVVMLSIDVSVPHVPKQAWSDLYAKSIISNGVIYGTIDTHTHIVVQVRYVGLLNSGVPAAFKKSAHGTPPAPRDEAIAVLVLDGTGMAYSYNMPEGACEKIALRCVSHLLKITTATTPPPTLSRVVNYRPRSPYDDNMYALYITAACASEGVDNYAGGAGPWRNNTLAIHSSSARCERPTRIISNLRFLMCLCKTECAPVVADLLLDETNTFDEFKRTVLNTSAE